MHADIIVIGGGMVGAAIAYGLARSGAKVRVLDEDDRGFRAARGNFGLTWVQSKGLGNQPYFLLTKGSVDGWADFANELREACGVDTAFHRDGGLVPCLGDSEAEKRKRIIDSFSQQAGREAYDCRFIDREDVQLLFPDTPLGERVTGASYSAMDGHANPLLLLRAMLRAFEGHRGRASCGHPVKAIEKSGGGFEVTTPAHTFHAGKVVIAAGLGTRSLAAMVGLDVPVRPQRGQVIVTERTSRMFPYPMSGLRQTEEGTVMIGATREDVGLNTATTIPGLSAMTSRAIAIFPAIAGLRLVRAWAALRVLTPDGFPVYEESPSHPGAYVATCHSGVTLAAAHANLLPQWVLEGRKPAELSPFGSGRFHVQPTA